MPHIIFFACIFCPCCQATKLHVLLNHTKSRKVSTMCESIGWCDATERITLHSGSKIAWSNNHTCCVFIHFIYSFFHHTCQEAYTVFYAPPRSLPTTTMAFVLRSVVPTTRTTLLLTSRREAVSVNTRQNSMWTSRLTSQQQQQQQQQQATAVVEAVRMVHTIGHPSSGGPLVNPFQSTPVAQLKPLSQVAGEHARSVALRNSNIGLDVVAASTCPFKHHHHQQTTNNNNNVNNT